MGANWLERHLIPLATSVREYEVRRLQALARARELSATATAETRTRAGVVARGYGMEIPVTSRDGAIVGYVDAVVPSDEGPVLRDFKSGAIYEPAPTTDPIVKDDYTLQLKLYAGLYEETFGEWPARLEVVPTLGAAEQIPFGPEECVQLVEDARTALRQLNRLLEDKERSADELVQELAAPGPKACRGCPYRPACGPYRQAAGSDESDIQFGDVWGSVVEVRQLGNRKFLLVLDTGGEPKSARGLDGRPDRHPALQQLQVGDDAAAFNLGRTASPTSFVESPLTVIYRLE